MAPSPYDIVIRTFKRLSGPAERRKEEKKKSQGLHPLICSYDICHIHIIYVVLIYVFVTIVWSVNSIMLIPCEVAVKSVVPAVRAVIARELIQSYGMRQNDVANLLGISQAAVSKYTRHVRGRVPEIEGVEEIRPIITKIVDSLANRRTSRYEVVPRFCAVCILIRRKRLMCELCKRSDPSIDIEQCSICQSEPSSCRNDSR